MARKAAAERDAVDVLTDHLIESLPTMNRSQSELARRAVRLATMLEDALAESLVPWNMTRAGYGVLNALWSSGEPFELRPSELKSRLLLTSGGVSGVLNRLEKDGLVERTPHPDDKRSSWVRLTPSGLHTADATARAWKVAQDEVFHRLGNDAARRAADSLRDVLLLLGDSAAAVTNAGGRRS